jgi:Domain of unknown function (DUF4276)
VSAKLSLEGGGDSKELRTRCREGFRKLLESSGFTGRMPRLIACGGRGGTFSDFATAHSDKRSRDYVGMLIDSEDPVADIEKTWQHLQSREGWTKPNGATDGQVLFMTTCMETWIVADPQTLRSHYGKRLRENALPALSNLEQRGRNEVQDGLVQATRDCKNAYQKGKRSFEVLGELTPAALEPHLPSFVRTRRILNERL